MIFPGSIENWGKAICLLMIYLGVAYIAYDWIGTYARERTEGRYKAKSCDTCKYCKGYQEDLFQIDKIGAECVARVKCTHPNLNSNVMFPAYIKRSLFCPFNPAGGRHGV